MEQEAMATILVIDDDPQIRRMVGRILGDAGYHMIEAEEGREGLKQMLTFDPAVIVTDIFMPEMEGIEFIRHVRKILPNAKVVAMSGGGKMKKADLVLHMAKSLGADCVLEKPFGAGTLLEAVRRLLAAD
jgi:CheY-like chemotaxis protein